MEKRIRSLLDDIGDGDMVSWTERSCEVVPYQKNNENLQNQLIKECHQF